MSDDDTLGTGGLREDSYSLTAWLRGDEELGGEAIGMLYALERGALEDDNE